MITIYALLENNQIRFIGKTRKLNLEDKLNQHLNDAALYPDKFGWISRMVSKGETVEIKPVLSYEDEEAEQYEKLFLNHFRFFVGLKLSAFEISSTQKIFHSLSAQKIGSLRTAI